ncbi:alkyl sulfatase dimerization domain-containing protein [Parasphingorhabdus sp.]|uniref:alkyl sulfatase dimerization domain-containing protein n=1 Tax=Parasphingorhabdus sp. TaxID=2709688 RepID=UPI0030AAEFE6
MAGGADMVSKRAQLLAEKGNADQALALTDSILSIDPRHKGALTVRLAILTKMHEESGNYNEKGWLGHGIREAEKALAGQ